VDESWEDVNWDGVGHRTYINQEMGTFCRLLYLGMVTPGHLSGRGGEDVLGESASYILKFYFFSFFVAQF
jgi:hypothetical protein